MLLPVPHFFLVLIGNLLVILLNVSRVKRQNAISATIAEPFSRHNPRGLSSTVLRRRRGDSYLGAWIALSLIIFAAICFLPSGLDVWDPGYLDLWSNTDFLINMAMTIGLFVLPGLYVTVFDSGDFFILTSEGVVHVRRKGTEEYRWDEITDIQRYSGEGGAGLLLKAGKGSFQISDRLDDPSAFYAQALKSLPQGLHDTEGYRWMKSSGGSPISDLKGSGKGLVKGSDKL